MGKKTICLTMIVKNEAHVILETLENLLSYITIDYWVISDTGSTDTTKEVITEYFKARNIPGMIHECEWRDFGYNRTKAFEAAYKLADYAFVWDADDSIHGNFVMPADLTADLYKFTFGNDSGIRYSRPQLFNNHLRWMYKGVLHEYAVCTEPCGPTVDVLGDYYFNSGRKGDRSKDPNKYLKDALILEKAFKECFEAKDTIYNRYAFYCAQSYNSANMPEKAIEFYKKALTLNLWYQERYISCLEIYDLYEKLKTPELGLLYLVESHKYDKERVECIYRLIKYYCCQGQCDVAYMYYTLIRDSYETVYCKEGAINLSNKLFAKKCEHDFYLPYYMIIVFERIKRYDDCAKMYDIICKHKFLGTNEWWFRNLIHNIQFCVNQLPRDLSFLDSFLDYIYLMRSRGITFQHLHNEIITKVIDSYRPLLTEQASYQMGASYQNAKRPSVKVMMSITTCKRFDLFEKTVNSILHTWTDVNLIDYFYCVDDNSSLEDRMKMQKQYPFFTFHMKSAKERGHRESMNIIYDKLQELQPTYWIHLEDDWLYFKSEAYVTRAMKVLETPEYIGKNIHQVVFNRNYGLMYSDLDRVGGIPLEPGLILHEKREGLVGKNCGYWPHYSLQPSMIRVSKVLELGNYNSPNKFFERDYADRYFAKGYQTAFFNSIFSIHIGKQHWESEGKNAYALNQIEQGVKGSITAGLDTIGVKEEHLPLEENRPLEGTMRDHLVAIISKIHAGIPFGLIRPSDGEHTIMIGKTLTNCDNWTYQSGGRLQMDLLEAVKTVNPNLYIGIPCNTCNKPWNCTDLIYNTFIDTFKVPIAQRTYANIFGNSNWPLFIEFIKSYMNRFILITSGTTVTDLPIKERFIIDPFLVNTWDTCGPQETSRLLQFIGDRSGELICFSAGPLSKIWIPLCMKINPNNMYLDIGAALDIFTKGQTTRLYTDITHTFSKEACRFKNGKNLVYFCVFKHTGYMDLLRILMSSIKLFSKTDIIDFLVFTSKDMVEYIDNISKLLDIPISVCLYEFDILADITFSRLLIFDYSKIDMYDKILYLDTDILIQHDISVLFKLPIEDKIYALKEGTIEHVYHGGQFFDFTTIDKDIHGMNSGILLFHNSNAVRRIFQEIRDHIESFKKTNEQMPECPDQAFINYSVIKHNMQNTTLLSKYCILSYIDLPPTPSIEDTIVMCHFAFPLGNAEYKRHRMTYYLTDILNNYMKLYQTVPVTTVPTVPNILVGRKYSWPGNVYIRFEPNNLLITPWCYGEYKILDTYTIEANWSNTYHVLRFNSTYDMYIYIRKGDIDYGKGYYMPNKKLKIVKYGSDGFGHQLEGMLRLLSLSLNNKADYQYRLNREYSFEHTNVNTSILTEYFSNSLNTLFSGAECSIPNTNIRYEYGIERSFDEIICNDIDHDKYIYAYDGVGCGRRLPPNFEYIDEFEKSLCKLREAFVETNTVLPDVTYNRTNKNVCCHLRMGDAVGTRVLDTESIKEVVKYIQANMPEYYITIHTDGEVDDLKQYSESIHCHHPDTIKMKIHDKNTDVLQVLSDFIHADILIMNDSSLSVSAHLLAKTDQIVICPNNFGVTYKDRILAKCMTCNEFLYKMRHPNSLPNIAFITLTNTGYIDYTLNCLKSLEQSAELRHSAPLSTGPHSDLHCYCIGKEAFNTLTSKGYKCSLIDKEEHSNFQTYRAGNWSNITFQKFIIIYENLLKYDYVCFTDGDIVYENSEFMKYLLEHIGDNDMLIQNDTGYDSDTNYICSGFMFIKSNTHTLSIFNPVAMESNKDTVGWDDQAYINSVKDKLKYKILPLNLFPNGKYYYEKSSMISPYIIHFNWVIGHVKKDKMKFYKKWFITNS